MISRKLDKIIENHYNTSNTALLLTGARQTGKTFALRKYAERSRMKLLEVNFLQDPSASRIFNGCRSAADVLLRLSAYSEVELQPGKVFIFFDEVQACPEVVTWIKFLVDEGSYKYALSGSLLGVELKDIRSVPVGYMSVVEVYPLNFREFAECVGVSSSVLENVETAWERQTEVDGVVHDSLMRLVALYLIVGGMPAVVQTYLDSNDIQSVQLKQKEIMALYRWDISQYDAKDKLKVKDIFDLIPSELDSKNKRFILKNLNERARMSRYEDGFLWLKDAGVALPTFNVSEPKLPMRLNELRNLFKLFLCDVGLLASQYASGLALKILNGEVNINNGAIYENFVAQQLKSNGFELRYFNSKRQGELDFVIEYDGCVVPLEVKSGKDYERHNALQNVMATADYAIPKAYVFYNGNMQVKGNVVYAPIYMLMFLLNKPSLEHSQIYKVDLTGLR